MCSCKERFYVSQASLTRCQISLAKQALSFIFHKQNYIYTAKYQRVTDSSVMHLNYIRQFQGCYTCSSVAFRKFCVIPTCIADDCRLVADARERRLCSTESRTCVVTWTHSTFGDRAFAAVGPGLWNSLPPHLRDADLPHSRFRRSLNTFLFG